MITHNHRFHGRGSLQNVYRQGKTVRTKQLGLRYNINARRRTFRTAVVVAKTISKSAVVRNRIRRRLYEIVRLQSVVITEPYDLIFTVYMPEIEKLSAQDLTSIVNILFEQAGITKKPAQAEDEARDIIDKKES